MQILPWKRINTAKFTLEPLSSMWLKSKTNGESDSRTKDVKWILRLIFWLMPVALKPESLTIWLVIKNTDFLNLKQHMFLIGINALDSGPKLSCMAEEKPLRVWLS